MLQACGCVCRNDGAGGIVRAIIAYRKNLSRAEAFTEELTHQFPRLCDDAPFFLPARFGTINGFSWRGETYPPSCKSFRKIPRTYRRILTYISTSPPSLRGDGLLRHGGHRG